MTAKARSGGGAFSGGRSGINAHYEMPPGVQAAFQSADKRQEEARALIAAGRENDALALLDMAKSEFSVGAGPGAVGIFDPVAVDAYVFLHRDNDACALPALEGVPAGPWPGATPRMGLLLARNGRLKESLRLDPARYALKYWSGYGQDAARALPNPGTQEGLLAAWCLAVGNYERSDNHWAIAGRYYKMGLDAEPGQPLLSLSYGVLLRDQNRLAEAIPYIETAARQVTGMLKVCADTQLREIRGTQAQRSAAAAR